MCFFLLFKINAAHARGMQMAPRQARRNVLYLQTAAAWSLAQESGQESQAASANWWTMPDVVSSPGTIIYIYIYTRSLVCRLCSRFSRLSENVKSDNGYLGGCPALEASSLYQGNGNSTSYQLILIKIFNTKYLTGQEGLKKLIRINWNLVKSKKRLGYVNVSEESLLFLINWLN